MKIKCLVVDDEAPAHKVLTSHINQTNDLELVGNMYNGQEALTFLQNHQVDIVFLDVEMPRLSGLEMLDCISNKPIIILTTAYSDFGFEAYQKDVLDYLLKPVSYPRFLKAVNKAISLLRHLHPKAVNAEIEVKAEGVLKKINPEDLLYIESIGNYIRLHFLNEKPILILQTLKYFESQLDENKFIRIHKSYLVNKVHVISSSNSEVTLVNNTSLPIGRKYSILLEMGLKKGNHGV
jgi:two-component system, LytTR family, response regulator